MQTLQQIIQKAIRENTDYVCLSEKSPVIATMLVVDKPWNEFGMLTSGDLLKYQSTLFPKANGQRIVQGQIEIPNYGVLRTIGCTEPSLSLFIFLPHAELKFEEMWQQFTLPSAAIKAPEIAAPPAAPIDKPSYALTPPPPPVASTMVSPPPPPLSAERESAPIANNPELENQSAAAPLIAPGDPLPTGIFSVTQPLKKTGSKSKSPASVGKRPANISSGFIPPDMTPDVVGDSIPVVPLTDNTANAATVAPPPSMPVDNVNIPATIHTSSAPTKMLDHFLEIMLQRKASDFHIIPNQPSALRIDGDIVFMPEWTWSQDVIDQMIKEITPPNNAAEFANDQDTDFAYEMQGIGRFRVNLFVDLNGRGAVLRKIPLVVPTLEELALPKVVRQLCTIPKGLVVVTGPTGSGKSTTLAAMVDFINKNRKGHILTMEDPIEFVHQPHKCIIRQREVHKHTASFSRALKAALREDPDVILLGELRDLETTSLAIEMAETGHLVLATLHTTTAMSTVDRIIGQFPADRQEQVRIMLAESLRGVVAQALLKRNGGGRVAAHECLVVNPAVSNLIREAKIHMLSSHMQSQKNEGNILLNESLLNLVQANVITPAEALTKATDRNGLIDAMRALGIKDLNAA